MDISIIGKRIAEGRRSKSLSQQQFADLLNVTQQCVHKWEKGVTLPDIFLIGKIAEVLCNFDVDNFSTENLCGCCKSDN